MDGALLLKRMQSHAAHVAPQGPCHPHPPTAATPSWLGTPSGALLSSWLCFSMSLSNLAKH